MSAVGWTGGQYSLLRAVGGLALALHFVRLLPVAPELYSTRGVLGDFDAALRLALDPGAARAVVVGGVGSALAFAVGFKTRWAALGSWAVLALLAGLNPLTVDSGTAFLGWSLLLHAALPRAPYGSIDARGRLDPAGGWGFPRPLCAAAWALLCATNAYSGLVKAARPEWRSGGALEQLLDGPMVEAGSVAAGVAGWVSDLPPAITIGATWSIVAFQLLFAPLALVRRARPWIWSIMAVVSVLVALVADSPDAGLGRLALLGLCFMPAWVPASTGRGDRVFYDGRCGLCHRAVRWVLAEDRVESPRFRFAPIDGPTFDGALPRELRSGLPDSVLVLTSDGELLDRSRAVMRLCHGLGGLWRLLALAAEAVPLALRDTLYDAIAHTRHRLFAAPEEACPLLPVELRERFDP